MLNFRRNTPSAFLGARDQFRLIALVALLALIIGAMHITRQPSAWQWMWAGADVKSHQPPIPQGEVPSAQDAPNKPSLGELFVAGAGGDTTSGESPGAGPSSTPIAQDSSLQSRQGSPASPDPSSPAKADLDRRRLEAVRDNTPLHLRSEETDPFYYVLDVARRANPAQLESQARRGVTFRQLIYDPDQFRGEVIYLEGAVRRLESYPAGANDYGLSKLYEAWLFTSDSHTSPYQVVCTHVPEGMPLGDDLREQVRVAGYFFKKNAYRTAEGKPWIAPLILAQRLVWVRRPLTSSSAANAPTLMATLGAMVLLGLGGMTLWLLHRWRKRGHSTFDRLRTRPHERLDGLSELDAEVDPNQSLARLEQQEIDSSTAGKEDVTLGS